MTAIVGVLNRRGLAIAADSAATHTSSSGIKISNNANKIFSLSKYHPVGVAIYNNLDFMGVPWDSIIKQFRNQQKEKKNDTLQGYIKPFFSFVRTYCLNTLQQQQISILKLIVTNYYKEVNNLVKKEIGGNIDEANAALYFKKFSDQLDAFYLKFKSDKADGFADYKTTDFEKYSKDIIDSVIRPLISNKNCPADFRKKFRDSLFALVCHKSHIYLDQLFTGLVFFGYGEKDLFPSLFDYKVTYAIDNRIKYTCSYEYHICSAPGDALIIPFAQTDVSNTVVRAVEDKLRQKFYESFNTTLTGLRDEIVMQLNEAHAPDSFVDIFKNLNVSKYSEDYRKGMDAFIDKSYIRPLLETVAFLDKEDLADMAESLVRMTCLKRHITTSEETVGGPVDVAIITKGDGFIWKKRKHYFDPELNYQFFDRNKE